MTIEVKSVTKVLRKITVLEDVNLILESGTIGPVLPGQAFRSGDCESLGCQRKLRQTKAQPQPETVSRHIL